MIMRKLKGTTAMVISIILVLASLVHIYMVIFGILPSFLMRSMHMLFFLPLCFLLFPASKKSPLDHPSLVDIFFAILSIAVTFYLMVNYERLQSRWMNVSLVYDIEVIFGTINVLLILEASRRAVTPMITIVASISIAYLFLGPYLTGLLYHSGFSYSRIIEGLYLDSSNGLYGMLTGISATYIIIFILFGSFITKVGMGDFFNDFSVLITGKAKGGPAKVAVISSGLFGSISGSSVANVYATGSFTIPLMKKLGYRTRFAAAVEAAASTGGQIMPPIMGAAAFIMAELTAVSYITICFYALIPAVLFFLSVLISVHFEAVKHNLKGSSTININKIKILKELYYFIPLVGIVVLLILRFSPMRAAFGGIILTILISLFKKETWMTPKKLFEALATGAKNTIMLAIALSCSGIVVSSIVNTGLGFSFGSIIMSLSGGNLTLILILAMILALILGCGLPSSAAYIISSALAAPILVRAGFELIPSHLFVFYSSIIAGITPPVAITAYAAAALAGDENLMATGIEAAKLGIVGFIIPYAFITNNFLVGQGSFFQIIFAIILTTIGVIAFIAGIKGYLTKKLNILNRFLLIMFGLLLVFYRSIILILF